MADWTPTRLQDQEDVDTSQIADGRVPVARDQGGGVFVHEYEAGGGGGGPPSGPAGGVLDGTYPNPGLAASVAGAGLAETADVLSVNVDGTTIEISVDTLRVVAGVFAAAAHAHAGEDITSGTVADARIASTIARDTEVSAAVAALQALAVLDGDAAGGVLSGTYPNPGFAADMATQAELDAHINDATDAHDGSAVSNVPAGSIAATDVQAAINELDTEKQPLDSDLTAIAALATTAFGRGLLELANQAALLSAAGAAAASHSHSGADITSGTVAEARIDSAIARDTEVVTELADQKRVVEVIVSDPNGDAITTGDGKAYFIVPAILNGHNLVAAHAGLTTVSSSGTPTIQVNNTTQAADMLSTRITIDANEKTSYTAAAAPVIDTGNDDVATGDELRFDIDVAGTGAKGLIVILTFEAP